MEEATNAEITNNDIYNALVDLNNNTVATNNSIKELQEYLIIKDKKERQKEETEQKQAEQAEKEQAELQEQAEKEQASADAEAKASADAKEAQQEEQQQTYEELLTSIDNGIQLNNQLMAVQGIYIGIVIGLLFMKIFIDRLTKR